jgi:hypothetical protein
MTQASQTRFDNIRLVWCPPKHGSWMANLPLLFDRRTTGVRACICITCIDCFWVSLRLLAAPAAATALEEDEGLVLHRRSIRSTKIASWVDLGWCCVLCVVAGTDRMVCVDAREAAARGWAGKRHCFWSLVDSNAIDSVHFTYMHTICVCGLVPCALKRGPGAFLSRRPPTHTGVADGPEGQNNSLSGERGRDGSPILRGARLLPPRLSCPSTSCCFAMCSLRHTHHQSRNAPVQSCDRHSTGWPPFSSRAHTPQRPPNNPNTKNRPRLATSRHRHNFRHQSIMLKRKRGRQHSIVQEAHPADFPVSVCRGSNGNGPSNAGRGRCSCPSRHHEHTSARTHSAYPLPNPTHDSAAAGSRQRCGRVTSCCANGCPTAPSPQPSCRPRPASRTGASAAGPPLRCWPPVSALRVCVRTCTERLG